MPNGAIKYDEWLCTCAGKETSCKNKSAERVESSPEDTQTARGGRKWERRRSSAETSPTEEPHSDSAKTTSNDTRRKITLLEEAATTARELGDEDMLWTIEKKLQDAKMEDADARSTGGQLDCAIAIAAKTNAKLEKQREQVERAQEKLNRLQAEATETDKKVTT